MDSYICTKCGSTKTTVYAHRPSIDDRYAIGSCETCGKPNDWGEVPDRQLIRADLWDDELLARRKKARDRQALLKKVFTPAKARLVKGIYRPPAPVTDAEKARARAILLEMSGELDDGLHGQG